LAYHSVQAIIGPGQEVGLDKNDLNATVRLLYDAYGRRDFETLTALIHDDVDWTIYGPAQVFPFVGHKQGRAAVLEALADIGNIYVVQHYDREITVVEEDRAAVLVNAAFQQRSTQRILCIRLANFLRFREGRLIAFREFFDSFDAVEQALARELTL
jgi:ketosteroid isomerase-like protein